MTKVAHKLREAKALIERGWTRQENCKAGRVCMIGAMNQAFAGDPYRRGADTPVRTQADRLLLEAVGGQALWMFNDKQPSKRPVIAAFDKAIALAEQSA